MAKVAFVSVKNYVMPQCQEKSNNAQLSKLTFCTHLDCLCDNMTSILQQEPKTFASLVTGELCFALQKW